MSGSLDELDKWKVFCHVAAGNFTLAQGAKALIDAGFEVAACEPMSKMLCSYDAATFRPVPAKKELWESSPSMNLALITGLDFWVLDVDGERGDKSLQWLLDVTRSNEGRSLLDGAVQIESGRGFHYYFSKPLEQFIPNTVSLLPGIDVRGTDGIIVCPPSVHANGRRYRMARRRQMEGDVGTEHEFQVPATAMSGLIKLVENAEHFVLQNQRMRDDELKQKAALDELTQTNERDYDPITTDVARYAYDDPKRQVQDSELTSSKVLSRLSPGKLAKDHDAEKEARRQRGSSSGGTY